MAKIKFIANWQKEYQSKINNEKGFLVLKYSDFYRKNLVHLLLKLEEFQQKKKKENPDHQLYSDDHLRDLEVSIEFFFKKRTLDQNALMWALYDIEANEMNGGQSGDKDQMVTREQLYKNDLEEYSDIDKIKTTKKSLAYYLDQYSYLISIYYDDAEMDLEQFLELDVDNDEQIILRVRRGTSKFNTKEMALWIERLFNRLSYHGVAVTNPGEIKKYWQDFKNYINDNKIVLYDNIMTMQEYKDKNPTCEACGDFIGFGEGDLAHIKSVGMGHDRTKELKKNYSSNWLHLHRTPCHLEHWHTEGIDKFLKRYKHLRFKVNTALKREYQEISDMED